MNDMQQQSAGAGAGNSFALIAWLRGHLKLPAPVALREFVTLLLLSGFHLI